jgi:lysyl-tRNA synthetase, class II
MALDASHDQIAARLGKLGALRERGIEPYPYRFDATHDVSALRRAYEGWTAEQLEADQPRVAAGGRILSLRTQGKTGFLDLSDGAARIQVYVRRDGVPEAAWTAWEHLDIGDWVGASGRVMRTRAGELTLQAADLTLLAKTLQPLPVPKVEVVDGRQVVHHQFADKELRYRRRYVDLAVNTDVRRVFELRTRAVSAIRRFLDGRGFLEVETPVLQSLHGGASARPFKTSINALSGMPLYLRIADELYLKRLIVGGMARVYEIGKDFRNEGIDRTHNPEFTMLELYQAFADYGDMAEITESLVTHVAREALGTLIVRRGDAEIDLTPPWRRITMLDAIREIGGVSEDVSTLDRDVLLSVCGSRGIDHDPASNPGQLLDAVFSELVQPHLVQPTFILDYPKEISPLAKQHRSHPRLTERFEAFIAGWELANAFSELNDPVDQRARFEAQMALRAGGDEEAQLLDEDFLLALEHGMPPTGGLGIGIDRLIMLLADCSSIRDVLLFPFMRPLDPASGGVAEDGPET